MPRKPYKVQVEPGQWVYPQNPGERPIMDSISALLDWREWVATGEARAVLIIRQYFDHYKYTQADRDRVMNLITLFGQGYRWLDAQGNPIPPSETPQ